MIMIMIRLQEFLQALSQTQLNIHVSRKSQLSCRSAPPQPVSILPLQKMSQGRHAQRRCVIHLISFILIYIHLYSPFLVANKEINK